MLEMFLASTVLKSLASVAGAAVGLTVLWNAADYLKVRPVIKSEFVIAMEQIEQASQSILLLRFQFLMQKRMLKEITMAEQQELCQIIAALQWNGTDLRQQAGCL